MVWPAKGTVALPVEGEGLGHLRPPDSTGHVNLTPIFPAGAQGLLPAGRVAVIPGQEKVVGDQADSSPNGARNGKSVWGTQGHTTVSELRLQVPNACSIFPSNITYKIQIAR